MQFLVRGLDGTDKDAMKRRLAVRAEHIALGDKLLASGNMYFGAALRDDEGNMKGSVFIMNFRSEKELQEWLDIEPYVIGGVWKEIEIHKASVRDPRQFSKSKEWYEEHGHDNKL